MTTLREMESRARAMKPRRYRLRGRQVVHDTRAGQLGAYVALCGVVVVHAGAHADERTRDPVTCAKCVRAAA